MILCDTGPPACACQSRPKTNGLVDRRRGPRNAPVLRALGWRRALACDKCLSLRHHEPSKQAARSIEREAFSFQQLLFYCSQSAATFRSSNRFFLWYRSTASLFSTNRFFLWYPFRSRPRERMRLRARAKWVPPHGYDWKKKQATQKPKKRHKKYGEHMGNKTHHPQNKIRHSSRDLIRNAICATTTSTKRFRPHDLLSRTEAGLV